MSSDPSRSIFLEAAIQQADTAAATVGNTALELRDSTEQLLEVSSQVAAASSQVVGGVIGAAAGLGTGAMSAAMIPAIGLATPIVVVAGGIIGLGIGVLALRGRLLMKNERAAYAERLRVRSLAENAEVLRREIGAAQAAAAPAHVVDGLWNAYHQHVRNIVVSGAPLALPASAGSTIPLALPAGPLLHAPLPGDSRSDRGNFSENAT
jgi:hypothetical protein